MRSQRTASPGRCSATQAHLPARRAPGRDLRHHLALVGRTDLLFADDAIARLHKARLGLPRALNNAAIAAATARKVLVDDDCAKKAVAQLTRD
jgi:type II secretory pathway predicted ATPase ExeA